MKSCIVIPYYNNWHLTHARLMEIYKNCPSSDIVIVNDCSIDEDCDKGAGWWQSGPLQNRLRYFKNKENKGFGYSMNVGAAIAIKNGADVILLLSNDVMVQSDIAKEAIEIIENDPDPVLIGGMLWWNDTGWNTLEGVGAIPYLDGWLLACHKTVWQTLGGFDPIYERFDFEDVDLSTIAWYKGIKLTTFRNAKVRHIGGQTVNKVDPKRVEQTFRNQAKWLGKWSDKREELKQAIYG